MDIKKSIKNSALGKKITGSKLYKSARLANPFSKKGNARKAKTPITAVLDALDELEKDALNFADRARSAEDAINDLADVDDQYMLALGGLINPVGKKAESDYDKAQKKFVNKGEIYKEKSGELIAAYEKLASSTSGSYTKFKELNDSAGFKAVFDVESIKQELLNALTTEKVGDTTIKKVDPQKLKSSVLSAFKNMIGGSEPMGRD